MILFFDTETTGKADFHAKLDAKWQPHIVQMAALVTDDAGNEINSLSTIIRPDGFEIPAEASKIHGITTERARDVGIPLLPALDVFRFFCLTTNRHVAHNIDFDRLVLNCEFHRGGMPLMGHEKIFCTMKAMTPICKLTGAYDDWKWPKLIEAHNHAFGVGFDGAHDALADVRACAKVYFWLQAQAVKKEAA